MERVGDKWTMNFDGVEVIATRVAEGYSIMLIDGDTHVHHDTLDMNLEQARISAHGLLYSYLCNQKGRADPDLSGTIEALDWPI